MSLLDILAVVAAVLGLVVACLVARKPKRLFAGVLGGVMAGAATHIVFMAGIGFANYVFPFNQIEYWFAAKVMGAS